MESIKRIELHTSPIDFVIDFIEREGIVEVHSRNGVCAYFVSPSNIGENDEYIRMAKYKIHQLSNGDFYDLIKDNIIGVYNGGRRNDSPEGIFGYLLSCDEAFKRGIKK